MKQFFKICIWCLLVGAALVSLLQGLLNAQSYSQDFQWSPARIFFDGRNPYLVWLSGNAEGEIILAQAPNYLHLLYVLFMPFGLMEFDLAKTVWSVIGISIGVVICLLLYLHYKLSFKIFTVLILVFFCSTPFRNGIGNGQHANFVMLFLVLPFIFPRNKLSFLFQGIGYVKYSFAPPFFMYNFFRAGLKRAILTVLLPLGGLIVFVLRVNVNSCSTIMQPLQVAKNSVALGQGDIMSIIERLLSENIIVSVLPAFALCVLLVWLGNKNIDYSVHLPFICVVSLLTFKHLGYDFVFLLPVLAYALSLRQSLRRSLLFGLVAWFWFGLKFLHMLLSAVNAEHLYKSSTLLLLNHFALWILLFFILLPGLSHAMFRHVDSPRSNH